MPMPRLIVFVIAVATCAVAYRLGGVSLWTAYAAGMTIAAAISAFVLWQDELLADVMRREGFDLLIGFGAAAALMALFVLPFNLLIAPAGELGGLLRRCGMDGPRIPRPDAHGITAVFE